MTEVSTAKEKNTKTENKIIVALDVPTADEARKIIAEIKTEVGAFKIGLQLFTAAGASFVREVVSAGNKVFLDVKFHDIPNTVAKASIEVARLGVWMFNLHASGGGEMMRRTISEVAEFCEKENLERPKIIGVTVLTSSGEKTLKETGIAENAESQVLRLAELSANCGLDGVVASPLETKTIRENIGQKDFLIITPGVRPDFGANKTNDGTNDDQKRVKNPKSAIADGADYLVIGRPILQAENKLKALRQILEEINS
ncbi:MAG: orotidine-5'-phosphate decarboxylase [Pyrinomonadaceae bacterium]